MKHKLFNKHIKYIIVSIGGLSISYALSQRPLYGFFYNSCSAYNFSRPNPQYKTNWRVCFRPFPFNWHLNVGMWHDNKTFGEMSEAILYGWAFDELSMSTPRRHALVCSSGEANWSKGGYPNRTTGNWLHRFIMVFTRTWINGRYKPHDETSQS